MTSSILGLLEIKNRRGLQGISAREAWVMEALAALLRAELKRQEKEYEESQNIDKRRF